MKSFLGRLARPSGLLRRYRADDSGNIAIIMGLTIVVLMLSVGAAVDIGRWLHARDQTLAAIDAAVLAGGRTLQMTHGDTDAAIAAASKFYQENVKTRLTIIPGSDSVVFKAADTGQGLNAVGNAYIATPFLQFARIDKLPLINTSQSKFGSLLGMRSGQTEISMMLDITQSMSGQKLKDMKDAAQKLVDIVTTANEGAKSKTKLAIVPFSEDIRLPTTSARDLARSTSLPACRRVKKSNGVVSDSCSGSTNDYTFYYLSDCVVERIGPSRYVDGARYTDDAPAANKYVLGHYTTSSTGSGNNKKGVCAVPSNAAVQPLTSNTDVLKDKIKNLSVSGATGGHLGTAWAWYTLSPNWNSLWPADNQAAPYTAAGDKDEMKKVAILMTDGEYNTQYDASGISANPMQTTNCPQAANGCSSVQAAALCTAMKAKGIEVWTVGFGDGITGLAEQTLKSCASDTRKYYKAADGDDLISAFTDIAVKLTTVYLSK